MNEQPELTPAEIAFYQAFFARKYFVTYAVIALSVLFFAAMTARSTNISAALQLGSDYPTLINFGAKTNFWVLQQKQWFRLVTPIFLHIGLMHLGINLYSLWQVGPIVEKFLGAAQFTLVYLLAGIGGVVGSLLGVMVFKSDGASAGASGAIFGLLGALVVISYKHRHELPAALRKELRQGIIVVICINLIFGIVNNYPQLLGGNKPLTLHFIDNWAHLGGLLTGAIVTLLLPHQSIFQTRSNSSFDKIILSVCVLVVAICFFRAYQMRPFAFVR